MSTPLTFKLIQTREHGSVWERDNPNGYNDFVVKFTDGRSKYTSPPTQKALDYWRRVPRKIASGACFAFGKVNDAMIFADKTCGKVKETFTKNIIK